MSVLDDLARSLSAAIQTPYDAYAERTQLSELLRAVAPSDGTLGKVASDIAAASTPEALALAAARASRGLVQLRASQAAKGPREGEPSRQEQRRERKTAVLKKQQRDAASQVKCGVGALEAPVESLPGVGPAAGLSLRARGLARVADLIWCLPLAYQDERRISHLGELSEGRHAVTVGAVTEVRSGGRGRPSDLVLVDEHGSLRLSWFRAPGGMMARYSPGMRLRVSGRVDRFRGRLTMSHPKVQILRDGEPARGDGVVPRYSEVPGLTQPRLRKAILEALSRAASSVPEAVPPAVLEAEGLPSLPQALRALHQPDAELGDEALLELQQQRSIHHRRLAFEEFFLLELSLHQRRAEEQGVIAEALPRAVEAVARARAALGFDLTGAQERVVDEITADLATTAPMRRLLQGDVGSGKTAVAMLAAAHAIASGAQVALMAPTEVLAEQHFRSLRPLMSALAFRAELLLGGARASHRRRVVKGLSDGTVNLAIGTHALLSEGVEFARLRLVIVDEQHRFGVAQRLRLVDKGTGLAPHLLVMTATPIPRSLALVLHGDLASSVLDEKPAGRLPVTTRAYTSDERGEVLRQMRRALAAGGQVYVVCPAIEEDEEQPLRTVEEVYRELSQVFDSGQVALLHGRLSPEEKSSAMQGFVEGQVKILVATTVIEVGVDVPAANLIIIEHAERFGLSQLHQLRGRVGRAGQHSACLLVHEARTEEARERLRVLCETDDGFVIAEEDLRLRGPGELFGRRQSGLQGFRFGDLRRDAPLLARARDAAAAVLGSDPELSAPEHAAVREALFMAVSLRGGVVKEEAG